MVRSLASIGVRLATFVAAGVAVIGISVPRVQAADDEATTEEVNEMAREVDRRVRGAEEGLARTLRASDRPDTRGAAKDAGESLAKLLAATRDDGRRAAAAMQWIIDHAPQ